MSDTNGTNDTSDSDDAEQRTDEATEIADQDVAEQERAVVHGPEGQAGAAGAGAPNGGVTGGDPDGPRD